MCGGGEGLAELSTVAACALPIACGSALLPWLIRLGVGPWTGHPSNRFSPKAFARMPMHHKALQCYHEA